MAVIALKEAEFELAGKKLRICVASGLSNARKIMDEIKAGKSNYDFIYNFNMD